MLSCYHHQAALEFFFLRRVFLDYNSTDFALIFRSLVVGIQRIHNEKGGKKLGNTLLPPPQDVYL